MQSYLESILSKNNHAGAKATLPYFTVRAWSRFENCLLSLFRWPGNARQRKTSTLDEFSNRNMSYEFYDPGLYLIALLRSLESSETSAVARKFTMLL